MGRGCLHRTIGYIILLASWSDFAPGIVRAVEDVHSCWIAGEHYFGYCITVGYIMFCNALRTFCTRARSHLYGPLS